MPSSDADETTQPKQRVTTVVLAGLAVCFVVLRLFSRKVKHVSLGSDDWTLIVGLIFVLVVAGINLACIEYGMGLHTSTLDPTQMPIFFKLIYAFEPLYITTVGIIKISVLLMYHRIFPVRMIKIAGSILATITIAWVISVDLVAIFQCNPIRKGYEPTIPGSCINLKGALVGNGVPNFVTDIIILALPARLIWRLQASTSQRLSIILVFLSGSFVVFASIYRFSLIFVFDPNDIAWTLADAQTWCVVETAAGVISACLPTIIPLIKACTKGLASTARSLSRTNPTQSASQGNGDVTTGSGGNFTLGELSSGNRASHLSNKAKGWTVIQTDVDGK
ncbi:hypothetical protein FE257_000445 [Aspergillus nanangensis]|uniref:Rhodopsin domain-containing protein n=1 Tax=Aspergillus nanangensis TaxID=2582783 RepID=A0AAD4GXG4_ASPNN|nr:hypothetical protein FE257_000445 [Aspergillus nanangensis]